LEFEVEIPGHGKFGAGEMCSSLLRWGRLGRKKNFGDERNHK
jgi:hypothetical protein